MPVVQNETSIQPSLPGTMPPAVETGERTWEVDQPGGVPAPVIRANMISLRVSYKGRLQVAFFERT
jgi:hypothetical protein